MARSAVLIAVALASAYDLFPSQPRQQTREHLIKGLSAVSCVCEAKIERLTQRSAATYSMLLMLI